MVDVAQQVEPRIVDPAVVGSNPIIHPTFHAIGGMSCHWRNVQRTGGMRISVETTGGLERKLNVAVPAESFESQVQERLKDTARQVRLPGFRPGRVPMKEVRRRFGTKVRADVAGEVIDRSFSDAVLREELSPVGQPRVDIVNFAPGADFEYSATFEVLPTFQVADLTELEVVRLKAEVSEADIDAMVEDLRERATIWEEVQRPCADGDLVTYRAQGPPEMQAEKDDDGWTSERKFVLGKEAEPLGDALRGLAAGEQTPFRFTGLPKDESAEASADVDETTATEAAPEAEGDSDASPDDRAPQVEWKLALTLVEEGRLPEMDAEFFAGYGVEDGTEESFLAQVRQNMQARLDDAVRQHLRNSVMEALRDGHEFPLPTPLVADTVAAQQERYKGYGIDPDQLPQEILAKSAEANVRTQLVVCRIVEEAELSVDPTRLRERIDQYASSFDDPDAVVQYIYSEDQRLDRFEAQVLEEQVVEHVAELAQSRTEQCSYMEALRRATEGGAPVGDGDRGEAQGQPSGEDRNEGEAASSESELGENP